MKKIILILLVIFNLLTQTTKADEGMWMLPLLNKLNMNTMQDMGLKITAEDIYSINQNSLKDAIVIFGKGCTGEMISDKGLLLTNHHCGFAEIQALSTLENDYLENGFWAKSIDQELPAQGLSVTFMISMEDVTEHFNKVLNNTMSIEKRLEKIADLKDSLTTSANNNGEYSSLVEEYFGGNQFFLIKYQEFKDVRYVGSPPSSIGKFGHDTDNWMWPRHTGDFSLFRVYCDKDGKPADYSADNVPYKPKKHLPISINGMKMDDFAMTLGYPGSTDRYQTSWGVIERMELINKSRIEPRGVKQNIWRQDMDASKKVNLQYATKFSRSSNYWKNSIGMNQGLERLGIVAQKQQLESEFNQWVEADSLRKTRYGNVLSNLSKEYHDRAPIIKANYYLRECLYGGTEIFKFAYGTKNLYQALARNDAADINSAINEFSPKASSFYKDYYPATDQKVMVALLTIYKNETPQAYLPDFYTTIDKKFKGDIAKYAKSVFAKSIFTDEKRFSDFLKKPSLTKLENDLVYQAGQATMTTYYHLLDLGKRSKLNIEEGNRLFIAGLMEMNPDKTYYPDANFTMRLSYGSVGDYIPRDAVHYAYFTTLDGVMEKEDSTNYEFIVPSKLKALHKQKDYGQYAMADGRMPVCFTTNNDITGGNSGSPVINAKGQLFGLAFDGNWEAMSGDITFEKDIQKCISVDIRYVLFIIDKYAGATNLIEEMDIIKD